MRLTRAQNVLRLAGNVQNRVDFWGSAPDPAEGAYDAPSDSLVVRGFFPSAIPASRLRRLTLLYLPQNKIPTLLAPKNKITEPPLSWPTDPLNLAVHDSNNIVNVCVSYWGFIPKLHFKLCLILL